MTEMQIPPEAWHFWFTCGCGQANCDREGYTADGVRFIVAGELRRLAVLCAGDRDVLLARAAELEAGEL